MNTRSIAFLLSAVGICFAVSQLKADEPAQQVEVTHDVHSAECGVERTVLEAWLTWEEGILDDACAFDEVSEPIVANENEPQESDEGLGDGSDGIVCADEAVEPEGVSVAEETVADESLESDEVSEETEQVDVNDVQIFEEAAADDSETTEEEIFANEELIGGNIWVVEFDASPDEGEFVADESLREEITAEETVEATEVEDNVVVVESSVEEAICDDLTDNMGNQEVADAEASVAIATNEGLTVEPAGVEGSREESDEGEFATEESIDEEPVAAEMVEAIESAVAQTTEEVAINGDLALESEPRSEESVDVEASAGEPTEESSEQRIDEEINAGEAVDAAEAIEVVSDIGALEAAIEEATAVLEVGDAVDAVEPTIEEETAVEEMVEATDDVALPVAVETVDEEHVEQEAVEEVQNANDAYEDLTTEGVVDNERTLEVVEPLIEEAELPETESESTAGDDVNESETGTVRTIELGGCTVTIQSDRQMDDFELLDMLWEAVDQLEAEMD